MPKVLGGGCGLWIELENDSSMIKVEQLIFCSKINLLAISKAFFRQEEGESLQLLSICNVQELASTAVDNRHRKSWLFHCIGINKDLPG